MNYAVNLEYHDCKHLIVTPRKRSLKHSLLYVHSGLVLLRLGKREYAIEEGQAWWIPADCLVSLSFVPNSQSTQVDLSQRTVLNFPNQSGRVELSELALQSLLRLSSIERSHPLYAPISELLKYEATQFKPLLIDSPMSNAISQWKPNSVKHNDSILDAELQLALLIREARKLELSGRAESQIAAQWFDGNTLQYQQLKAILLA
ncbi:AraC family ligand binding domain-containing protein [Vibrio sp. WJH972]